MKRIVQTFIITTCLAAPAAFGQGLVGFANNPTQPIIDGQTGSPAAGSAGYTVGLYWSASQDGEYRLGGTAPIVNAGVFNNGGQFLALEGSNPGDRVFVQVRAWTGGHDSYESALMDNTAYIGQSDSLSRPDGLGVSLVGPGTPADNLVIQGGMQSFTTTQVPEPSTIAFGILGGIGALMLMRRRK